MLLNTKGEQVQVPRRIPANLRDEVLIPLREVLEPAHAASGKFFRIETRAHAGGALLNQG